MLVATGSFFTILATSLAETAKNESEVILWMLIENIKAIRKSKWLSQEELAVKLNVVRQTIYKWEKGVSQT